MLGRQEVEQRVAEVERGAVKVIRVAKALAYRTLRFPSSPALSRREKGVTTVFRVLALSGRRSLLTGK